MYTDSGICSDIEISNRQAGKLPPAFGTGGMLELEGRIGPARPGPFTNHNFFGWKGQKRSARSTTSRAPVGSMRRKPGASLRTRPHMDDDGNEDNDNNDNDHEVNGDSDVGAVIEPPANEVLLGAMSRTRVTSELDEWGVIPGYHHIFRLLEVLLNPPPDVDLEAIDGLSGYLSNLCTQLVRSPDNGVRNIVSHCWWVVHGIHCISTPTRTCSDIPPGLCDHSSKKAKWNRILSHLERSQRRLINWCPTVKFPSEETTTPKSCLVLKSILHMFFNPEPSRRLRMDPIEGMYTYHENLQTDMDVRSHHG